ncbi:MAG: type II secretion system F family protein [Acidimicrobiia bacterium]
MSASATAVLDPIDATTEDSPEAEPGGRRRRSKKADQTGSDLKPQRTKRNRWWEYELTPKRIKPEHLMNFSRQSASFVRAGIPIIDALEMIAEETNDKLFRKVLLSTADEVRGGTRLSEAFSQYSNAFPSYYIPMIRSAELTGRLDQVLDQLAAYLARDIEARRKVRSALTYPAVVAMMSVGTVVVLAVYVMPKFKTFFEDLGSELPVTTRMLLAMTDFFSAYWWVIALAILALVIALFVTFRFEGPKLRRDAMMLRLPAAGTIIRFAVVERFCRIMSVMIQAGVPLPEAMLVASESTSNRFFQRRLSTARDQMMRGEGMASPIIATKLFPSAANQMIRVGESTGTLDAQLDSAASFYGQEVEYKLKRFTDLFEPAVIVFMGLVVGFVAVALVTAMYGVYGDVQQ